MTEAAGTVLRPPQDMTRAEQHLHLLLQRFSFCLDRQYVRVTGRTGSGEVASAAERQAGIDAITAQIDELDNLLRTAFPEDTLPLPRLRRRFGLDESAALLLVAAAAPGFDVALARRAASLSGRMQPDAGFLLDVLAATAAQERAFLAALRFNAPLARHRLLLLGDSPDWVVETPTLHRRLVVPERIMDWLRGEAGFEPARFGTCAALRPPPPVREAGAQGDAGPVAALLFRQHEGRPAPLLVTGPALAGKASAVMAAAGARGLSTLDVKLEKVVEAGQPVVTLLDLAREALLCDAVLLLRHGEILDDQPELRRATLSLLDRAEVPVAITLRGEPGEALRQAPGAAEARVEVPGEADQLGLWRTALPPSVPLSAEVDLPAIVRRYRLSPGDILLAAADARDRAQARGGLWSVTGEDLSVAVRGRLRHRLRDVAEVMTTTLTWDDVVLPPSVNDRIAELLATIHHSAQVMDAWGFGRKVAYGRAVSALFAGPPGTGKTMVAGLIARELGLELFRVDLSRVVSKWVGETEKNLGRAFDEARHSQAVLLFDEADSLFARRTDVKSSNDRYANLEVNYLLQRIESFDGIVLLTSNNQAQIDDAFRRRLRFRIAFPIPDAAERTQLWRTLIPASAPLAEDVDFVELGQEFDMSGGHIKNAVVRAAFLAAATPEGEGVITNEILMSAARLEWEEMGRLART